jgi:pilus assembly protein CpaC
MTHIPPMSFILKVLWVLTLFSLFGVAHAFESTDFHEATVVGIGRHIEWPVDKGSLINISNGDSIRVVDRQTRLQIFGKRLGETEIRAGKKTLTVHVMSENGATLFQRLQSNLALRRGLVVTVQGKTITVKGRLLRLDDWFHLLTIANGSGARFSFQASIPPELLLGAKAHFKSVLRQSHLPDIALEFAPSAEATVPSEPTQLKSQVERVLGPYGFKVEMSTAALSLEPMVRVRLLVAEVRKSMARTLGIQWPDSLPAQLLPTPRLNNNSPIQLSLNALEQNGMAKVLASPTLLCRSGKEARFLAGGEIPIKIVNHKTQNIVWKQYGILLKISPKADFSGRMSIAIETEVSMPDDAHKVDGIPGLLNNRIESHFDLTSSRTIVLSGLIKKEWSESTAGLPGLSDIPIIGSLFGSKTYKDNRSELMVFVTPEIALPDEVTI